MVINVDQLRKLFVEADERIALANKQKEQKKIVKTEEEIGKKGQQCQNGLMFWQKN